MALQFDHGLASPIRTSIYQDVVSMLADITRTRIVNTRDWDPTETPYGPFLTDVVRTPLPADQWMLTDDSARSLLDYLPANTPSVAIYVGPGTDVHLHPSARLEYAIAIDVYYSSGHSRREIEGRISPDPNNARVTEDPGLDAIEDMLVSRLLGHGLPQTSVASQLRVSIIGADIVDTGDAQWRVIRCQATVSYLICVDRDAVPLASIDAHHDVQEGGIIHEQRFPQQ